MATDTEDVMYKLGRIESLAESMNEKLDKHIADSTGRQDNHETRINKLENNNAKILGGALALGTAGSFLLEVFTKLWPNSH